MNSTRVRFAPSPTGFLHVGGARTALFNWLFARATGGKFLLRIEDTDPERSEARFTEDILEALRWLGYSWDEEPIYQSKRFQEYRAAADRLLAEGKAYRCSCTQEELDAIRKRCEQEKKPFRYPGICREKTSVEGKSVIRLKMPRTGTVEFTDLIRGHIAFSNADLDDWVILRSDGSPTYNFCVVIDDHAQHITHVLRGDDHINNTPRQINLYQAMGFPPPSFAHLPMILGTDKAKLSKRHGAASTLEYRKMGYLPDALTNFLVRLGWSHGDQEIFSVEELKEYFSLEKIGKASAVFNPEKLNWVSGQFMRDTPPSYLADYVKRYFQDSLPSLSGIAATTFEKGIAIIQGKVKNIVELIEQLHCLFGEDPGYSELPKEEDRRNALLFLAELKPRLSQSDFVASTLETVVKGYTQEKGIKLTPVAQAIRFAVTGGRISPGLFDMLEIQGKDTVLRRMDKALSKMGG